MVYSLLRFPMSCVLITETAIFLGFHTVWMVLFFFGGVVVTLLAVCAG